MPQSLAQASIHVIFSAKERRDFLKDELRTFLKKHGVAYDERY